MTPNRLVYLSVFCCLLFVVTPGSEDHRKVLAKGLIPVPEEDVDEVNDMSLFMRRRWGLARSSL